MHDDKQKRGFWNSLKGKGYYIALILCAVAIGISGYLYYQSNQDKKPDSSLDVPSTSSEPTKPAGYNEDDWVQAVGTDPTKPNKLSTEPTLPSESQEPTGTRPVKTAWPVEGESVSTYAVDHLAYNETTRDWRVHNGVDIAAEAGTDVKAAADGTVYTVYNDEVMGTTVVIRHTGGYVTQYASLSEEVQVAAGDTVTCGQVLGTVGKTALTETALGDHVHFTVLRNDTPVDPAEFIS